MTDRIAVYYSDAVVADADSFSPSAGKPKLAVAAWQAADLPVEIRHITPVTHGELALAHDRDYVRQVLACESMNGFGNRRADVARSLPYTSGALLCAARHALDEYPVACAPVSGFHHAHYASGAGYCTFNGLAVVAAKLLAEARVDRIMILDTDMHYGDGTEEILQRLGLESRVENVTFGRWFNEPADAEAYLEQLDREVQRFADFDLILYQAGADVHVDDPLGGVLTTEQMDVRDRKVFAAARSAGVPLAWDLAGGYQTPVAKILALHTQTMRACCTAYVGTSS